MLQVKQKKELRKKLLEIRRNMHSEDVELKSKQIIANVLGLPVYQSASMIACYVSMMDEVQTKLFIENSWELGKQVAVPVTDASKKEIYFYHLDSWIGLLSGTYGIWQPDIQKARPANEKKFDFVLVPGVGFDLDGNRLGFGMGYYDKFLSRLSADTVMVGLAFECQLVQKVPIDAWDRKMDYIVTENRVIKV